MCIASFYTTEAGSSPCLHNIEGSKGIISSPRCDTITNCSWLITVSNNHSVFLTFTTFELYYKGEDNLHKKTTQLQVWDGENEYRTSLGIFYGTKRPFSLRSSGRHLFLWLTVVPDVFLCNFQGSYISTSTIGIVSKYVQSNIRVILINP